MFILKKNVCHSNKGIDSLYNLQLFLAKSNDLVNLMRLTKFGDFVEIKQSGHINIWAIIMLIKRWWDTINTFNL